MGADIDPKRRFVRNVKELTSRLKNHEIPQAITELERSFEIGERKTVDVCLASNIIEVGIDVQRLGLMAIVGQPKNTAQYIQVSGRVGREVGKPGMVVALYSPTKSRDRSHYEHFRSYHERLYAQVEPTSVTPFSTPTLERALHGLIATYVRMKGSLIRGGPAAKPNPVPEDLLTSLKAVITQRMDRLKCEERAKRVFDQIFERRRTQWRNWAAAKEEWVTPSGGNKPLLHAAGSTLEDENEIQSWPTPMSMRSVDADCRLGQLTNARIDNEAQEGNPIS
jgi:superfamily II DNA or RNA helicase